MKRVLIVLVMVLSVSTFVAAVPYPYAAYELETQGNLEIILDEVVAKYAAEAQSEKGSILPWSEAGAVSMRTRTADLLLANRWLWETPADDAAQTVHARLVDVLRRASAP